MKNTERDGNEIFEIISMSKYYSSMKSSWGVLAVNSKLAEEYGEFIIETMIRIGLINDKPSNDESIFEEAADVMICLLDSLTKCCPELTENEICANLDKALSKKKRKWDSKINYDVELNHIRSYFETNK